MNFEIRFPRPGRPGNLLADVVIRIGDRPGLHILGAAVWANAAGGSSVTLPAKRGADGRYHELFQGDSAVIDALKRDIVEAYLRARDAARIPHPGAAGRLDQTIDR